MAGGGGKRCGGNVWFAKSEKRKFAIALIADDGRTRGREEVLFSP